MSPNGIKGCEFGRQNRLMITQIKESAEKVAVKLEIFNADVAAKLENHNQMMTNRIWGLFAGLLLLTISIWFKIK